MLLKDVLIDADFDEVWKVLSREYRLSSKLFRRYQEVFEELHKIQPKANENQLEIRLFSMTAENKKTRPHYDIMGFCRNDGQKYALELIPWDEWLGFDVAREMVDLFGVSVLVACCLHEMTLSGYHSFEVFIARNAMSQNAQNSDMIKKDPQK